MRAELHLARSYLLGLRRRTQVATVTLISFIGVALGVIALVVTLALLEGFQSTIRSELVHASAHARIKPATGRHIENPEKLVAVLQGKLPDVEIVQIVRGTCLVVSLTDAVPASVVGRSDVHDVETDQIIASRTGLGIGDQLQIISPRMRLTPLGPVPIRMTFDVTRIHQPEPGAESGSVRLPLQAAQRLLWGKTIVESVELTDLNDPWGLGHRVEKALEGENLEVEGMMTIHRAILLALSLERMMIFVAVGLILVVAALNLLCNVAMVAAEKRKDLAVLAGLGLSPISLRRLFLFLGLGIGGSGAVAGAILGTAIAFTLDFTGALPLPRGVFVVSSVPFRVQPVALLAVVSLALGLSIAASWLPSRLVARREPAEGLRYE